MVKFGTLHSDGTLSNVRIIPQSALCACPHYILDALHYRMDNTCKCDDPTEQKRMIAEWGYSASDFYTTPCILL
mgnify:CR=1 FL=1